jgi:hypothetical protein
VAALTVSVMSAGTTRAAAPAFATLADDVHPPSVASRQW